MKFHSDAVQYFHHFRQCHIQEQSREKPDPELRMTDCLLVADILVTAAINADIAFPLTRHTDTVVNTRNGL
jgi:hypothetical protein